MKLVTYEAPVLEDGESIDIIDIKSMILLFIADHYPDGVEDTGVKSEEQYLKCVYAAYDANNNMHIIVQYYSYSHSEESSMDRLRNSCYFDGSLTNKQLITTINFFTADLTPEASDLITEYLGDGKYAFYARVGKDTDNEQTVEYLINEKIRTGIEMLHSIIATKNMSASGILEANIWMYNETNENDASYRNIYKHVVVKDFTIKDISKSVKKSKHVFVGAMCMEFDCSSIDDSGDEIYTVLMSYARTKKLRSSDLTMDLGLMETTYDGAYVIGSYSAVPLRDEDAFRLVGYSEKQKRFVIFDLDKELYAKFCERVEKLEEE